MRKIIFTGGGTGGHIMPNLAIINDIKDKYQIKYIGSKAGMEKDIVSKTMPYFGITTCKLKRSLSLSNFLIPFKLIKGVHEAKKILRAEKPNLVFSKGGYVSVPVVLAAKSLKIPIVSHESDYTIGLANKFTSKYSKAVCTSFEDTAKSLKNGVYTGSPIRKEILCGNKQNIVKNLCLKNQLPNLLIVGGSLGSQSVNNIIYNNSNSLSKNFNIIHIVGKNNKIKTNIKNYNIVEYASNIQDYYDLADIVITRGGSNVIFELLALKKPMLIIPLQKGSRGDQVLNANIFEKENIALKLLEDELENDDKILINTLNNLYKNKDKFIKNMSKKHTCGNKKIIEQIEKYLNKSL
ncbi:MAG TPA: UDP-N-acetylglucosamine--N-acetylmuramyl-(pentapeptide) pyrophosphoryl-undecaprenol N-acetylglucosamine transferase [Clostridiales bacterium]|nr:UDP-N-acetylglucosamine--N-acetylmuramyl-(pentapeptide) pyrophosphoryl-undecaprenol N-acetylglucosamine transferase [Clostridiales bacterium]